MSSEEQHYTEIDEAPNRFLTAKEPGSWNATMYRGRCSCGWIGRWMSRKRHAVDDADEHVIAMTR